MNEFQVQGRAIKLVPAALAISASFTAYKLMKLLTFPKKIPGAYYPPLPDPEGVIMGALGVRIFGHSAQEITEEGNGKSAECYLKWIASAEQRPMVMFLGFGTHKISPAHPEDLDHIFVKNAKNYPKCEVYHVFERMLGKGLLTQLDEAVYPIHRGECAKAFAPASLKLIANECVNTQIGRLLERLGTAADSEAKEVEMNTEMLQVGLRITAQAAFRFEDEESLDLIWELYHDMKGALWNPLRMTHLGDKVLLIRENRRLQKAKRRWHQLAQSVLDKQRALPPPEEGKGKALIDYLAHTTKMDNETVLDNMVTFLFAGFDTTANVMFMVLYYVAKHPKEQEKLFEEVSAALSMGQHPTLDDVKGCDFLRKACKEALRLRPPAAAVTKVALEDDVLPHSKQFIPKGLDIDVILSAQFRLPELFGDDANEYRPDRWDDPELEARLGSSGFTPFSFGNRNCPGRDFALNETHLVIATVIRNFKVSWIEGEKEPFFTAEPVTQAKFPVKMRVERREN